MAGKSNSTPQNSYRELLVFYYKKNQAILPTILKSRIIELNPLKNFSLSDGKKEFFFLK